MEIATAGDYEELLAPSCGRGVCLIHSADTHAPSKQLVRLFKGPLSKEFPMVKFVVLDFIKSRGFLPTNDAALITSIPTILFFEKGNRVGLTKGFNPQDLLKALKAWTASELGSLPKEFSEKFQLTAEASAATHTRKEVLASENEQDSAERRRAALEKLTKTHDIMLFIKGSKSQPFCKFSKAAVAIMEELGLEYHTFDILRNEEVRSGMKEYSNWPTFPQLYYKGEFIGGVDVMKELHENSELLDALTEMNEEGEGETPAGGDSVSQAVILLEGPPNTTDSQANQQIFELLQSCGVNFSALNVLEEPEKAKDLCVPSDASAEYPRAFYNGSFVGDLKCLKSAYQSGGAESLRKLFS